MLERFRNAIGTGEVLRVIYDGGSSPGASRDLLALEVLSDGKVRAKCLATGQAKTFVLSKMRPNESGEENYVPGTLRQSRYSSLDDVFSYHASELQSLGWHIQLEDEEEGRCLSVHRKRRSSGRPLKGSVASLTFNPLQWDFVVMPDGGIERMNERPSVKPFVVRIKGTATSSLKDLENATEKFLAAIRGMPAGSQHA